MTPGSLATTAIGSLPHNDPAPAIDTAFRLDIPCLPALPRRSVGELLVPQGLFGLPGLTMDQAGNCTVDVADWRKGRLAFQKTLTRAIDGAGQTSRLELADETCSAWKPFLLELSARKTQLAKIQLVGPLTACRAVVLSDGRALVADLPIANQVFQLLAARAFAMIRAVQACGTRPIFFFDEPGLTGLPLGAARNLMGLQELRVAILALRRAGALVGLHCCGETQWERILPLGLNFLSVDVALSLSSLLRRHDDLASFLGSGGRLALGIIPTSGEAAGPVAAELAEALVQALAPAGQLGLLRTALLTPACGLALQTIPEAEATLAALKEAQSALAHSPALA
jgi:hypothetical protein